MSALWQVFIWCILIGLTVFLTIAFNFVGFIIGVLLCMVQASSFRRRKQDKQHKELLEAIKNK